MKRPASVLALSKPARHGPQAERISRPSPPRLPDTSVVLALSLALTCLYIAGCGQGFRGFAGSASKPSDLPAPSRRYVYPPEPPVISLEQFCGLLDRLRGRNVLVCFWSHDAPRAVLRLNELAGLQQKRSDLQVLAIFIARADLWASEALPMLKAAGANYPCFVVRKPDLPDFLARFGLKAPPRTPTCVLLDPAGRLAGRIETSDNLERSVTALLSRKSHPSQMQPARQVIVCNLRIVSTSTGTTLAHIVAHLPAPALGSSDGPVAKPADQAAPAFQRLAARIEGYLQPGSAIAVAPFRNARIRPGPQAYDRPGLEIASRLAAALRARGLVVTPPEEVRRTVSRFDFSLLAAEFDPTLLSGLIRPDRIIFAYYTMLP